ncbi:MAG: hypothetical protein WDM90_18540 [Ferruginibacter sp.]
MNSYGSYIKNYFFELPDGNSDGSGFGPPDYPSSPDGNQSLEKLKNKELGVTGGVGQVSSLTAVDGSAVYTSWADLTATILAIVNAEKISGTQSWIHTTYASNTGTTTAASTTIGADLSPNLGDHSITVLLLLLRKMRQVA